jgi:hypothetical protein
VEGGCEGGGEGRGGAGAGDGTPGFKGHTSLVARPSKSGPRLEPLPQPLDTAMHTLLPASSPFLTEALTEVCFPLPGL